jgi:hypothetical protein
MRGGDGFLMISLMICSFHQIFYDDEVIERGVGKICSMYCRSVKVINLSDELNG